MITYTTAYDISVTYGSEAIDYPGDIQFQRNLRMRMENGDAADVSNLIMSAHSGTHLDLPSHFNPGGKSIDDCQVSDFILPAQVVEIKNPSRIEPYEIRLSTGIEIKALLFKTENSLSGKVCSGTFSEEYVYLSPEAADFCVAKKIRLVGIDYSSVDRFDDESFTIHRTIMKNNIMILEGITLAHVPAGDYTLICLPLKIKLGEASPVRAVLLKSEPL